MLRIEEHVSDARCPYCHDALEGEGLELVTCDGCQTQHHGVCAEELGRCAIAGCERELDAQLDPHAPPHVLEARRRVRQRLRRLRRSQAHGRALSPRPPSRGRHREHGQFSDWLARTAESPDTCMLVLVTVGILAVGLWMLSMSS